MIPRLLKASVIIPALNAGNALGTAVKSILDDPAHKLAEIIIVNDGLDEEITLLTRQYPVKVVNGNGGGGAAAARNIGVKFSRGQVLVFLDADCRVSSSWLTTHLKEHERNKDLMVVGGSIRIEKKSSFWARCDHYCSWYNVHPYHKEQWVPNHPAANMSMSRFTFDRVGPFKEDLPKNGVHEEIEWQDRLLKLGGRILFKPLASVGHIDRSKFKSYLTHNYRWGYNSIQVKGKSGVSRYPWVFKKPLAITIGFIPFSVAHTLYTIICWLKAGKLEPLFLGAFIFIGRLSYAYGMAVGGNRYLLSEK